MGTPYLGEVRLYSFNFPPVGWAMCNGQSLAIAQNQALFALLGTTYGGNGTTNFQLPNLQGRMILHVGGGLLQGQIGGEQSHTLSLSELGSHTHPMQGSTAAAMVTTASGNVPGATTSNPYSANANTTLGSTTSTGGGQAHNNMAPSLVMNYCIALQGIFPSRN